MQDLADYNAMACRPEDEGQQPGRARRKTQQALAYEVLVHFTIQIRAFYTAVAKAIQTPVRRREELGTAPTMAMRAAAINMAVVLRENMRYRILPVSVTQAGIRTFCCGYRQHAAAAAPLIDRADDW